MKIIFNFLLDYLFQSFRSGSLMRLFLVLIILSVSLPITAQQNPFFVTYDSHMEEPGNLEISTQSTVGFQKENLPTYLGQLFELEYGVRGWWSSALYLEGSSQQGTTVFSGYRLENRFRPLKGEHKINPVLYFEFEDINEASRIQKEVVGNDGTFDESLSEQRGEKEREIELKLILSSTVKNWTVAENFIVEKNLKQGPFEFGYAVGAFRSLANLASGKDCTFCRENFAAGVEVYGGIGTTDAFGFSNTAQYIAPGLVWNLGKSSSLKISPGFGLTAGSNRVLLRMGYMYEIDGFGSKVSHLFGAK
jgi:hypothetical protein